MKRIEYQEHLRRQGMPEDRIEQRMVIVRDFVAALADPATGDIPATAGKEAVRTLARRLVAEGRNTVANLSALADYTDWLGHRRLWVALTEVMDCHNALEVLASEVETRLGRRMRDGIFREPLPPLGAGEEERCAYTRAMMERMAELISPEEARLAWYQVQHGIPAAAWQAGDAADREKFRRCGDIDAFFALKRQERDTLLTRLRDEHKLWYTVEITDAVLAFVKNDPEMEVGKREGDKVFVSKIPYNAVRYLQASDPAMKRYFACHCPLAREAILKRHPISPAICHCSLGFASHYLAGLDREFTGEVLESAVKGDTRCRFVFHLGQKTDGTTPPDPTARRPSDAAPRNQSTG